MPTKDIRVVSPFTVVANRLRTEIREVSRLRGVRAGTVHITQGQEAPVVILVLGGNPQSPGAKKFAIAKPNLLNVALTRAQRRFYVVGERSDWIGLPQFQHLSALPVWPVATHRSAPAQAAERDHRPRRGSPPAHPQRAQWWG